MPHDRYSHEGLIEQLTEWADTNEAASLGPSPEAGEQKLLETRINIAQIKATDQVAIALRSIEVALRDLIATKEGTVI